MTLKINRLKQVYDLFEEAVREYSFVCKEKCSACCTCNVTMTGLEAQLILSQLNNNEKKSLKSRILDKFPQHRFLPKITTNQLARLCVEKKTIPTELNDPSWGACPLLENDLCRIYPVRPFGCRALLSKTDCRKNGTAQIPPLLLTISNLFLQFIEQLDEKGVHGNLSDILSFALGTEKFDSALIDPELKKKHHLLTNEVVPAWMIPPEHRPAVQSLFMKLKDIL